MMECCESAILLHQQHFFANGYLAMLASTSFFQHCISDSVLGTGFLPENVGHLGC